VFRRQTAPLVEVYRQRGLLVNVDGLGQMDDVTERIVESLEQRGIVPPAADVQPAAAAG
jgi:adenylate kinase